MHEKRIFLESTLEMVCSMLQNLQKDFTLKSISLILLKINYCQNWMLALLALFVGAVQSENITFAFGSCFKFFRNHQTDVFQRIAAFNPQYFFWLGDAAYIDVMPIVGYWIPEKDMDKVAERFAITKQDKYYSEFIRTHSVKGVYDDHDFNQNNGGKHNPYKEETKQKYLDFIGEPLDSPLRTQRGIYQAFQLSDKIKVIMTDVRYEADKAIQDTLGEEQWIWLESQFQEPGIELFILTSGVQVMPDDRLGPESWFPKSKDRLYDLIARYDVPIVFLSGDVHYSELIRYPCPERLGKEIYEFTSSGLTFANADHILFVDIIFKFLFPPTFSNHEQDHYYSSNFGVVQIEVNDGGSPVTVVFETYSSKDSTKKLSRRINVEDLKFNAARFDRQASCVLDLGANQRFFNNLVNQAAVNWNLVLAAGGVVVTLLFLGFVLCLAQLNTAYGIYCEVQKL